MIMDSLLEFADNVDASGATGGANVGDIIDLGATPQDFGTAGMYFVLVVTVAFVPTTSSTIAFYLVSDSVTTFPLDASETYHITTPFYDTTALTAGTRFTIPLPPHDFAPYERYLGVQTNTTTSATTAGSIDAFLTKDPKSWKSYPDAVN